MADNEMTYAEEKLIPLGFKLVTQNKDPFKKQVVFSISHLKIQFDCCCPSYPNIKALGCPLHHDGVGGSWPISDAEKIATLLSSL